MLVTAATKAKLGSQVHETYLENGRKRKYSDLGDDVIGVIYVYSQPGSERKPISWENKLP